jgi:hypothetical protein
MVEMYTEQRYLDPESLRQRGMTISMLGPPRSAKWWTLKDEPAAAAGDSNISSALIMQMSKE